MGGLFQSGGVQINITQQQSIATNVYGISCSTDPIQFLPMNLGRKGCVILNQAAYSLYAKFGIGASSDSFTVKITPGAFYEMAQPPFAGIIEGVWEGLDNAGIAHVTELI